MDAILNQEQEELLKRTRDTLGQLRDLLGDTAASKEDRAEGKPSQHRHYVARSLGSVQYRFLHVSVFHESAKHQAANKTADESAAAQPLGKGKAEHRQGDNRDLNPRSADPSTRK